MKRAIIFHSPYKSDEGKFSTSSTKYEALPVIFKSEAGNNELRTLAQEMNLKTVGNVKTNEDQRGSFKISHYIKLDDYVTDKSWGDEKRYQKCLGFIELPRYSDQYDQLPPIANLNRKLTRDQAYEIVNNQNYGVNDVVTIDNEVLVVMDGWSYFHEIKLLGYSIDSFEEQMGAEDRTFEDEVFRCGECGESDWNDTGYEYNYKIYQDCIVGTRCGCYDEAVKNDFSSYVNNSDECIEASIAETLESDGQIEFIQRFVGGMTDPGRLHSFNGESVETGQPDSILKQLTAKEPKGEFLFVHDESGQFQTYFSVYRVLNQQ
jgi:hypothetical protein